MRPWRVIDYQTNNAFENMAIDEAIYLETLKKQSPPTLRFYGWRPSAVSIGYFQDPRKEVNFHQCRISAVDVVRRLTGGKAVYHHDEVTYCLVCGQHEKIFPERIAETYEIISRCLARGLSFLGISAALAPQEKKRAATDPDLQSCCFSVPSGHELLADGRKICGSAQTRGKGGFLQHGALLLSFDPWVTASLILSSPTPKQAAQLKKSVVGVNDLSPKPATAEKVCEALRKGFVEELGIDLANGTLTPSEKELSAQLVKKYRSDAWLWRQES
jgi:lipoate-protein ligase A